MSNQRRGPMGGHGRMGSGEKAKDFKGTLKRVLKYIGPYKFPILCVMLFAVGSTIFNIIGPKVLGKATTEIFTGLVGKVTGGDGIDFGKIGRILITLLILYGASSIFSFIQGFIMTGVTQKLTYRMRKDISEKINRLPMNYFDTKTHGEVLSRVTNDVDTFSQSLNQTATQMITSVTTLIGVLVMMLSISPLMTMVALLILPISLVLISFIVKHSQKYFKNQQEYLGHVNGQVEEVYGGHSIVKAFNKEDDVLKEFNEMNDVLYQTAWKSQFFSGMMMPIMQFVGNLGYVAVCVLGSALAMSGEISFGVIVAFILYVRLFTSPLSTLAQGMTQMQTAAAAGDHVFDFLHEKELPDETGKRPELSPVQGEVEFEHVRFSYPNHPDKIIIKDFSAHIQPGQKVAIVGPTGAGKTTMVNLLMRFFEINSGNIKIDGVPTSEMTREGVHDLFSMVLQDTWLFEGTVRENLVYNKTGVTDQQLEEACRACGIYHFIETLPHGFDTVLDDSIAISSGQKQLLTIARAMIQGNPMLILDEATSSVDTRTELITQQAMDRLTEHRTSFVIAHRLSTIKNADLILVLKDGDIIEQGTHKELLAKGGFYADLYNSQFEKAS